MYLSARDAAVAIRRALGCEGTSMRQHNEPGGAQDAWHFHVHVFPRTSGDRLYERNGDTRWATAAEREELATRLRAFV